MAERILDMYAFDIEDSSLYFNCENISAIFHMDIDTGKTSCVKIPERYAFNTGAHHYDLRIADGKSWFAPYGADEIMTYDLKTGDCEYIDIPKLEGHGRKFVKFCGIFEYGRWLILVPAEYPAILKMDRTSCKITAVKWEERLLERYPHFMEAGRYIGISSWDYEVLGNTLYLFASNVSIRYSMDSDELDFCEITNEKKYYAGIARYGSRFALADRNDCELAVWDEAENKILKTFDLGYKGLHIHKGYSPEDDGGSLWVYRVGGGIVVLQSRDDFLRFFDDAGRVRKIDLGIGKKGQDGWFVTRAKQKGSRLVIPLEGQNAVMIVDTDDWSVKRIGMKFGGLGMICARAAEEGRIVENNGLFYGLDDLIDMLKNGRGLKNKAAKADDVGSRIYQSLR